MVPSKVILHKQSSVEFDPLGESSSLSDLLRIPRFTNEADVREEFVYPLLRALGYSNSGKNRIEREIHLAVSALIIGSKKKSMECCKPDYVLSVENVRKWLIDAKAPNESVLDKNHICQAYSYAIHKEVCVPFYVICNGEEFAVFRTSDQNYAPFASFRRYELNERWQELYEMLSAKAFKTRLTVSVNPQYRSKPVPPATAPKWDKPINRSFIPQKQRSPIHAGTHPYFTKRAWNIVQEYIKHFTEKGETVLDPFGGAGVTAIESILLGRRAIHIDINPIANFMTEALAIPVSLDKFALEFKRIRRIFSRGVQGIYNQQIPKPGFWYPRNVRLPSNSDVELLENYFTPYQLASMSLLRHTIMTIKDLDIRKVFLLVFSSTLVKCNISFHNTGRDPNDGGGDAGFLKYYRYQIPRNRSGEQNPLIVFEAKYKAMLRAKVEISHYYNTSEAVRNLLTIRHESATRMTDVSDESVDYVFTDPPYGSNIGYLDCSTLWNAWLRLPVSTSNYELEAIAGGQLKKTDEKYIELLQASIREIYRVLKPDRWFSIVFASDNPRYWHAVRDYSIQLGFEHVNTICQPSDRKTVKKNQNPLTVFKGELILNFRKRKTGRNVVGVATLPPKKYILNSVELTIVLNNGKATIEDIMHDLIPKLWESGLLGAASNEIDDLTEVLKEAFDYDKKEGVWKIKPKTKIGCHIPVESRIKFYLLSCLNRGKNEGRKLTIDDIIMEVLPFLRNGVTPANQDIIGELHKIAASKDGHHWELNMNLQAEFNF